MRRFATYLPFLAVAAACRPAAPVVEGADLVVDENAFATITRDAPLATDFFIAPKTQEQLDTYLATEPEGRQLRLIVVESAMNVDSEIPDLESAITAAKAYIDNTLPGVRALIPGHDRLVFTVVKTPLWLSSSSDFSTLPVDAGWTVAHSAPPEDLDAWAELVEEVSRYLDQSIGDEIELAYEISNEPDLYWSGTEDELLDLYAATSAAIQRGDPGAPIGGLGTNQWDGKVRGSDGPVTDALLERVVRDDLPLDFLAFHAFVNHPASLNAAVDGIEAMLAVHGKQGTPLWVTEWNTSSAIRGGPHQPATFATLSTLFRARGVHDRYCATWADYEDRNDSSGYGLLSYESEDKPVARVHRRLVELGGLEAQYIESDEVSAWVAKDGECRVALVWRDVPLPELEAFLVLGESLTSDQLAEHYTDPVEIVADLRAGTPPVAEWQDIYDRALDALITQEAALVTVAEVGLDLGFSGSVTESIRMDEDRERPLELDESDGLSVRLPANAVGWIRVCPE